MNISPFLLLLFCFIIRVFAAEASLPPPPEAAAAAAPAAVQFKKRKKPPKGVAEKASHLRRKHPDPSDDPEAIAGTEGRIADAEEDDVGGGASPTNGTSHQLTSAHNRDLHQHSLFCTHILSRRAQQPSLTNVWLLIFFCLFHRFLCSVLLCSRFAPFLALQPSLRPSPSA